MSFFKKNSKSNFNAKILNSYHKIIENRELNAHISFNYALINKILEKNSTIKPIFLEKDLPLYGLIFALKDNFATKDIPMTIGCQFLRNFYPYYDSTVYKKLLNAGAQMICKSNLDELSMAGTGIFSLNGAVKNPWNNEHISGGSSSGSSVLVASGLVDFAIGTDTGDSIRKPAAYCGVVGFKPSWGLISRYGLADYAPSLDTVGVFTNSVADCATVINELIGYDDKDFSTYLLKNKILKFNLKTRIKKKPSFVVFKEFLNESFQNNLDKIFSKFLKVLENKGYSVSFVSFDLELLMSLNVCYEIISYAEASSCNSNLLGTTFGENVQPKLNNWFSQITANRSQFLGSMVKRRFAIGSFVLSSENKNIYFHKAKIIRRVIVKKMSKLFKEYDFLIAPATTDLASLISQFNIEDPFYDHDNSIVSNQLLIANFCGSPSITIPLEIVDNLPFSISLTANRGNDEELLKIANNLEKLIKFKNPFLNDKN